jgi:aminoglycoside phosphotransferase (APT) family kinase protein
VAALETWLAAHVHGFAGPLTVSQFNGGQSNPTYRLETPRASYVLRRKPAGPILKGAHDVLREARCSRRWQAAMCRWRAFWASARTKP